MQSSFFWTQEESNNMQTRFHSWLEANANTWIGLVGSLILMHAAMQAEPYIGQFWATNLGVALCTAWSLLRGFGLRRYFNAKTVQQQKQAEPVEEKATGKCPFGY